MANETLITDLVAREAIEQLVELDGKMDATLGKFKDCARELARGLKVPVEVNGDVDKLKQLYDVTMKDIAKATEEYTQQMQAQQKVLATTTNTISRQLAEQEKLNKTQREAFTQEQRALDIADRILGSREQNIRQLASYKKQLEQVKAERKAGMITEEEALAKEMELKTAMQETQKVLKNETKMNQAAAGSYQQLSLQLERLKQAQKQLNEEEKAGEEGQALEKEIQNLDAHLKDLAADMGEFQRNVGNYAVANGGLRSELRETTMQLAQMLADGVDPTSDEFLKLAERAGTLKDAMSDAKATINDYANDTKGLSNTISVVETGMAAWQTYLGALSAFGIETDDANESLQKMMGIMSVLNGMQKISTELTTNGTGAYRAYHAILKILGIEQAAVTATTQGTATALNAQTTATVGATTAATALRVALAALGIGAVIALIGTLYSAYSEWNEASEKAEKQQKALAKEMDSASTSYGENRVKLTQLQQGWKDLKTEQEKNEFIKNNKDEFDKLGVSVNNVGDAENLLVKNADAFITSMKLRAQATAYGALAAQEYAKAIKAMETGEGVELTTAEKVGDWFQGLYKSDAWKEGREQRRRQQQYNRSTAAGNAFAQEQLMLEQEANNVLAGAGITASGSSSTSKSSSSKGSTKSAKDTVKDLKNDIEEMIKDSEELINEWSSRMGKISVELAKVITSSNAEALEEQINTVNASYDTIEEAIKTASAQAIKDESEKYDTLIAKAKSAGEDTKRLEEAKVAALSAISAEYNEQVIANNREREETLDKMRKDYIALATQEIQNFYAGEQAMADVAMTKQITDIKQRYAQGLIDKEQYEEQIANVGQSYAEETVMRQIDSLHKQLEVANLTKDERIKLEQELAKATADLENKQADAAIDAMERVTKADEKEKEKRQKNTEMWVQNAGEALSKISDFASAMFDNRIAQIEQELEAEQQQYDTRVAQIDALAEQGTITTEEAEIRKRDALAETQRKQEQLEKKKADMEYKKAVLEKANSIAQIGIATALGIMQTYAQLGWPAGIPGAIFIGAMGAIQAATALAQPIKAYKEGTQGKAHPGGLAIVGDGDKPEVVMFGGRAWITPDSPTLVDLPKGAQVLPDADAITLQRMGSTLVGNVPRNGHSSGPIIINDYDALESKMANNTKVLARGFNQLGADLKRELRRQSFRDYINRRT